MLSPRSSKQALGFALAAALTAAPASATGGATPTLNLDQTLYEVGQTATATLTGNPGDFAFLLADAHEGPTYIPGVGTLAVDAGATMTILPMGTIPPSGVLDMQATPGCNDPAAWQPFFLQGVTVGAGFDFSNLEVLDFVRGPGCHSFPEPPLGDPTYGNFPGGTALWLPGVGQDDYVFLPGARYTEYLDGTATLRGVAEGRYDSSKKFRVDVVLDNRMGPGDAAYPPAMSPKKELKPGAYRSWGGPVDTGTWHYYQTMTGTLYGMDGYAGGILAIDRFGPSFQVGYGGDNVSLDFGASGWFNQNVVAQPSGEVWAPVGHGDFNITIRDVATPEPPVCVRAPEDSQYATFPADVAVWLPGIGTDYVLETDTTYTEYLDGTARLVGEAYRPSAPTERFLVDVLFSDRVDIGDPNYPPPGSPKKEMHPTAYIEWGGPVDPSTWHYYETFNGLLIGVDSYAGGLIAVDRFGPSWQVGLGANNVNTKDGASGWFNQNVITTPAGYTWVPVGHGDFNVQFIPCPPPTGGGTQ